MIPRISIYTLAFILLSCTAYSQQDVSLKTYPEKKLRLGFVFTDLVNNRMRLDLDYRVDKAQVLGIGLGLLYGTEDMDNRFGFTDRQPLGGYYTNLSYKYYYAANRSGKVFHFTRVTGFYQNANVTYYGYAYVPYQEDGLTFLSYDEVEQKYNAQTTGIQGEIGFEFYYDQFFMEVSFGFQYRRKTSQGELPPQFRSGTNPFDIDYTGMTPIIGYKIGVYLD